MIESLSVFSFSGLTPNVVRLLRSSLTFSRMTIIIGDNGSGKSQLIGLLAAGIDPDFSYERQVRGSGISWAPFKHLRQLAINEHVQVKRDNDPIILHTGINLEQEIQQWNTSTSRTFGSNGESVLYDLLYKTTDIHYRYFPHLDKAGVTGADIIDYKTEITRRFIEDPNFEIELKKPAVLLADEPELGLSPKRVKALFHFFIRWVEEGNQLIMTTNHPWMFHNWPPKLQVETIDLDSFAETGPKFSYDMK
jgi:energy-coupling factor transporter ATP-binding protein EcfA2